MNARQQKIAYVYFDNFDGNTAHLNQILNMLYVFQKNGGPTTLITGRVNYKQLDAMLDALSITRKFNVVCLPIRLWQQWFFAELISRVVFSAAALVYLLFHTFHFVYSRDFFFIMFLSYLPKRFRPSNIVFESHRIYSKVFYSKKKRISHKREQKAIHVPAKIVAISPGIAEDLGTLFGINPATILLQSNGVNKSIFKPTQGHKEDIIIYSGSFLDWKGLDVALEALKYVKSRKFWLYLVGGTSDEVLQCKEFIRREGIRYPQIKILPRMAQREVIPYLSKAKIALISNKNVLESVRYTSPLKLYEYRAMGLPILCPDMPSIRNVVNEDQFIFFKPDDPIDLARAIDSLAEHEDLLISATASASRAEVYSWEDRATNILNFINETRSAHDLLRICIISSQILGPGKTGGFGSMTKQLARSLAERSIDVVVATLKRTGQKKEERIDGFTIMRLSKLEAIRPSTYKNINADIYHSQAPNLMSTAAMIGEPHKKHVVTCRDPRDVSDWWLEFRDATWKRKLRNVPLLIFEEGPIIKWTIKRADKVAYAAHWIKAKTERMYGLKMPPVFLPNIEDVPEAVPEKTLTPTVCFVGRLDGRKRPELFIGLAGKFPHVSFLMVGKAEEGARQERLLKMASKYSNMNMFGYLDKFDGKELYEIYNQSWIMVNTASREALPLTIIEAAGRGCAILSHVDPDGFASKFGFAVTKDNFAEGLASLLENDRWREKGESAHAYVLETYGKKKAIDEHIALYEKLLRSAEAREIIIQRPPAKNRKDAHTVSVVVPTVGRPTLSQTQEALLRQTRPPDEIIIVEDTERHGVSWARNEGIKRSGGDLIAFIDDDCVPPPDWIAELVSAIDRYNAAGAGGTYQENDPFLHEVRMRRQIPSTEQEDRSGLVGTGGNVMYRKSSLGLCVARDGYVFNEFFQGAKGGEDGELSWRLRRYGAKLVFIPVYVIHLKRVNFWGYMRYQFNRGIGIAALYREQRRRANGVAAHKSLLWGEKQKPLTRLFRATWHNALGPFDIKSFSKAKYFFMFWIGEKFKALGFVYALAKKYFFSK